VETLARFQDELGTYHDLDIIRHDLPALLPADVSADEPIEIIERDLGRRLGRIKSLYLNDGLWLRSLSDQISQLACG